jgi:hypothetical protein
MPAKNNNIFDVAQSAMAANPELSINLETKDNSYYAKKSLEKKRTIIADLCLVFGALGFILMILENELSSLNDIYDKVY